MFPTPSLMSSGGNLEHPYGNTYNNPYVSMPMHTATMGPISNSTTNTTGNTASRFGSQASGFHQGQPLHQPQLGQRPPQLNTISMQTPHTYNQANVPSHTLLSTNVSLSNGQVHPTEWRPPTHASRLPNGIVSNTSTQSSLGSNTSSRLGTSTTIHRPQAPPQNVRTPGQIPSQVYTPSEQLLALSLGPNVRPSHPRTTSSSNNLSYPPGMNYGDSTGSTSQTTGRSVQGYHPQPLNYGDGTSVNSSTNFSDSFNLERDFPVLPVYKEVLTPQKTTTSNTPAIPLRDSADNINAFQGKLKSNGDPSRSNLTEIKSQTFPPVSSQGPNTDTTTEGPAVDPSRRRLQTSQKLPNSVPQSIPGASTQPPPSTQTNTNLSNLGQSSLNGEPDPYGLLGLLRVLKLTDRDLNMLAFGTDLTTLGLNLSSQEPLYATFSSPFSDTPLKREPEYQIPTCYYIRPPLPPPTDKMSLFSDETLFYIFYSMPRDALQIAAANELQAREWTYHTELKLWFQRSPGTTAQVNDTLTHEQGSYIYFDVQHWKKRLKTNFRLDYDKLHLKS